MYDIGIIGGGTAGMTAAIYGQRAGKKTLIIEGGAFGGQITSSPNVENYPGIASVSGSEFSMNLLDQATKLGADTVTEQVTGIRDEGAQKVIVTKGQEYPCKSVILATGVTHRHLGAPGEERLTGAGVSYCATCDGMFFRGKTVVVAGGGNSAAEDALVLSKICKKVYLVHRRDTLRATKSYLAPLEKASNLEFVWNKQIDRLIAPDGQLTAIGMTDRVTGEVSTLETDGLFVAIGRVPDTALIAGQVELDEQGYIVADETTRTSVPGVFAVGDARVKPLRQIITAASDGATASKFVEEYLNQL